MALTQLLELEAASLHGSIHAAIDPAIDRARDALKALQRENGHWSFELEADCTIPSEYILMMHFMDEIEVELQRKLAVYVRGRQNEEGGWPLYYAGETNISCTVKAYYALKLAGDSPDEPHMKRARDAILARGGAARANVFTRIMLAQFRQIPWRGVPFIPVEIMLLPRWFFFHLDKVSYWSRTVMVPLFILTTLRAHAKHPSQIDIQELFVTPPEEELHYFPGRSARNRMYLLLEQSARRLQALIPSSMRERALHKAETWCLERLNGEDGLGAIFPAMVNAYEALAALGYPATHPLRTTANEALRKLLVVREDDAYCQPCVSPIWDTALACHALLEAGEKDDPDVSRALDWMAPLQVREWGDWAVQRPGVAGGGWAFQYRNDHYPDLDDTAVVAWAMERADRERYSEEIDLAADWLRDLQSRGGGFASFDADNTHFHLNEIPFADHGALLDPPTADVSARVVTLLARLECPEDSKALQDGIEYLEREQEHEGAWWGRWGTNYIYGTWSVMAALRAADYDMESEPVKRGARWLKDVQRSDGGWGETNDTYARTAPDAELIRTGNHGSNAFQTAWALLGLLEAGEADCPEVERGIQYLMDQQTNDGLWDDPWFTAPGFPRVFYLKYHGYAKYFPLWALARYRNLHGPSAAA
ncbi:MAG: squalene--hopene cyclase [Pseudomonadales bacterium]